MTSSSDGSDVGTSPWDKWMYEGRAPYTWELEERPPYPWDPDAQAKRPEPHFFSADSSTQEASSQSTMGFYFVTEYEEDLDGDGLPNGFELTIGMSMLKNDSDGDTIDDATEDFDGDGAINFEEYLAATDPVVDDNVTPTPLSDGLVLSGEEIVNFPPDGINREGVCLFPDGNLADGIAVDEPTPGRLRIRWHSTFIQYGGFAGSVTAAANPPPHRSFLSPPRITGY